MRTITCCLLAALLLLTAGCTAAPEASPSPAPSAPAAESPQATPESTPATGATPTPAADGTPAPVSEALSALLPSEEGYSWTYFGFAEYDHAMTLDAITQSPEGTRYTVTGEVYDPSGGESDRDFSISLTYIVDGESLVQEKDAPMMLDTFDRIELIRAPLQPGTAWQQTIRDADGNEMTLTCTIEKIEGDAGSRKYTVLYRDSAGDYYERREIQEGVGVISYEKLFIPEGDEPFPIGYSLFTETAQ
jgi:hypothetical protein